MSFHPIQVLIIAFALFAFSRSVLRFREGALSAVWLAFWGAFWAVVGTVSLLPRAASRLAEILGVGRGVDALMYMAIIGLFYGVFRLFVRIERIEHEITLLVRALALQDRAGQAKENQAGAAPPVLQKIYAEQESRGHHSNL
ncbi:MAG: DUF2304 family protein [Patescibacteria group bacterium]